MAKKQSKKDNLLKLEDQKVQKIFYESDDFTCGLFTSGIKFQIKGILPKKCTTFLGYYSDSKKYGKTFVIKDIYRELSSEYLPLFLSTFVTGIGPKKAEKAAKDEGLAILEKYPDLKKKYPFYGYLLHKGIALSYIDKIYDKYGGYILDQIIENPYWLISKVRGFGFKRADYLALRVGVDPKCPYRIDAAINYSIQEILREGNSCINRKDLIFKVNLLLHLDTLDSEKLIIDRLDNFNDTLVDISSNISLSDVFDKEKYIKDHLEYQNENIKYKNIVDFSIEPYSLLNEGQREALTTSLNNKNSIISGPAGSGKSFLIKSIITYLESKKLSYLLCSSTGKAAKKIEEYSQRTACTLHKLLKYQGTKFNYKKGSLKKDYIIIDEVSMCGIDIIYNLLQYIDKDTCVIFIGDANQLPSVEYGNVLKDLLRYQDVPRVVLTKCVRQAGILKENSLKILEGIIEPSVEHIWYKITKYTDQKDIYKYIGEMYKTSIRDKLNLNPITQAQLLTPVKKGLLGTYSLNKLIQKIIHSNNEILEDKFLIGDRVIYTKNNYDIGIMNGTVGWVEEIKPKHIILRLEEDKTIEIPNRFRSHLELAYALTVHKYQGEQIPFICFICHKSHSFIHSKNLFYTAVTRATKTTAIVGDSWAMLNCASKTLSDNRKTFLSVI